ncbi:hypothetical protein [Streptomyces sp. CBMA156]|uniref:hypothetical protein n=1 Tax=Streptomyces sp. CBMA156 TaxID=1930280 RepID=UPI001661A414|nr:hypothetical protein [Streptomyces sp. CBMA156]MBD0670314.1 hypothetical protein [Streptomyces sp. CBMA156]
MSIDIALYDGHPNGGRRTGPRMLHLSSPGEALTIALARHTDPARHRLGRIDPYGDTLFDEQDAGAAFEEATALLARCTTEAERAAVRELRNLLAECAATPGSRLEFLGD